MAEIRVSYCAYIINIRTHIHTCILEEYGNPYLYDKYTEFPYTRCSEYGLVYYVRILCEYVPYMPVYLKIRDRTLPYIDVFFAVIVTVVEYNGR